MLKVKIYIFLDLLATFYIMMVAIYNACAFGTIRIIT